MPYPAGRPGSIYRNVYRVAFDLLIEEGSSLERRVSDEPVTTRLILAGNVVEALAVAERIKNELRPGAVHKHTAVRDVTLFAQDVLVPALFAENYAAAVEEEGADGDL